MVVWEMASACEVNRCVTAQSFDPGGGGLKWKRFVFVRVLACPLFCQNSRAC